MKIPKFVKENWPLGAALRGGLVLAYAGSLAGRGAYKILEESIGYSSQLAETAIPAVCIVGGFVAGTAINAYTALVMEGLYNKRRFSRSQNSGLEKSVNVKL